jgi:hypothetical protein
MLKSDLKATKFAAIKDKINIYLKPGLTPNLCVFPLIMNGKR